MRVGTPRLRLRDWPALLCTLVCSVISGRVLLVWTDFTPEPTPAVVESLRFVRTALERGADTDMQRLFPEGYFFSHLLRGLAWTNLASAQQVAAVSADVESAAALEHLYSARGTAPFSTHLEPAYGVFYNGWVLLLEAEHAALSHDPEAHARLFARSEPLAAALTGQLDQNCPFLQAYPGQIWPVDTVVAVAALRRVDRVTGSDHGALITRWLLAAASRVDPRTGLLPHRADPYTCALLEGARGTSQSIVQRLWPLVDPASAESDYRRFKTHFVRARFGFVGVQEYPDGADGESDLDTGPLLFGLTLSGSAVAIGSARAQGDLALARTIQHELDLLGLPIAWHGERRYLFGLIPIGDAFAAWARSTPPAPARAYAELVARWPLYLWLPWLGCCVLWLRARRTTAAHSGATWPTEDRDGPAGGSG